MDKKISKRTIFVVITVIAVILFLMNSIHINHACSASTLYGCVYSIDYGIVELPPKHLADWKNNFRSILDKMGYEYVEDYKKAFKSHGDFLPGTGETENFACFLKCKDKNAKSAFTLQQIANGQLWVRYIYRSTGNFLTVPARITKLRKNGLELPDKIPYLVIMVDDYALAKQ